MNNKKTDKPFKVNPLVNAFMRLTGEWPLSGPPPLSEDQYKKLFDAHPAFVDYFPIIAYDEEESVFLLDDYINVAKIFEVSTRYMAAKTEQALDDFNEAIARALNALPTSDNNPYIVQIYANKLSGQSNFGEYLQSRIDEETLKQPFTKTIINEMIEHADMLSHERGLFQDKRLAGNVGWRASEQKVYFIIYRKLSKAAWKKNKKTPAEQLTYDMSSFMSAMQSTNLALRPMLPSEVVNWLSPFFGNNHHCTEEELTASRQLANHDLAQKIFTEQPAYHHEYDSNKEKGIWQFGEKWSRFLTLGGISAPPRSGAFTLGQQRIDGSTSVLAASMLEKLPVGTMLSYTIIPQSDAQMKYEMSLISGKSSKTVSREADFANEQVETAYEEMIRYGQKIFYAQMGIYISANSKDELLDHTEKVISEVNDVGVIQLVEPKWDLFPQHAYIKALPCAYDFANDRNAMLRARKTYTSHLASILPFFGNKSGSENPCYVMFTRTGEPFYLNPFHPDDKQRVSHELFFGPSGTGKSATICYMTLMSMAVNDPRTFLFDYGNSFKLLADFAESQGKKVKRIKFSRHSTDVIAPFFETAKALEEVELAESIDDLSYVHKTNEQTEQSGDEDDEDRSYLAEMEAILLVMVTGANKDQARRMTQTEKAYLQRALVRGLKLSVEQGEAHARPTHIAQAMGMMADEESKREGSLKEIVLSMLNMAASIEMWTKGLRGLLFNRIATGFDPDYDLTVIEVGSLAKQPDMLAVAGMASIFNITALAEQLQHTGRQIEIKIDEVHLWAKVPMLIDGLLVGAKVFRKLGTWLCLITQDISDFDEETSKILSNAEFWWLMRLSEKEIKQAETILGLDDEVKHLIKFPTKESGAFVEGISISDNFPDTLIRYVLPPTILALAQTEKTEKDNRKRLMQEKQCTELEAAMYIAEDIRSTRSHYQTNALAT